MEHLTPDAFKAAVDRVAEAAEAQGVQSGPVHFELCDRDELIRLAAYGGMPARYAHWSFGKTFDRLKTARDYRQARIYEMVIHQDPVYAFVDRSLTPAETMLVAAHVLAHAAFFRSHCLLRDRPRDPMTWMARHRQKVEAVIREEGVNRVEAVLDGGQVLADFTGDGILPARPAAARGDLLGYVAEYAPGLSDPEREMLLMVRDEARYFRPQILTKVGNEGYATFWHRRLLQSIPLAPDDRVTVARFNADLVSVRTRDLNPYRLGYTLVRTAWEREGWAGLRRVSEDLSDVALVREYLDADGVSLAGLRLSEGDGEADQTEAIRSRLLADFDHGGVPYLEVDVERTRTSDGSLHLVHRPSGRDLDFSLLEGALGLVATLWGKPVILTTRYRGVGHRLRHDGNRWSDEILEARSV